MAEAEKANEKNKNADAKAKRNDRHPADFTCCCGEER